MWGVNASSCRWCDRLAGARLTRPVPSRPCASRWDHRLIAELGKRSAYNPAKQLPFSAVTKSSEPSSIPRACERRGIGGFCRTSCSFQFPGWVWTLLLLVPPCMASGQRALSCAGSTCVLAPAFPTVDPCFWVSWIPGSCSRQEAEAVLLCRAQC